MTNFLVAARDKEVVMLKVSTNGCNVYIAKNDKWLENDVENYLKKIFEAAPISMEVAAKRDDVWALSNEVMTYCMYC